MAEQIKLEINSLPTVLPYLLSKEPKKPLDLLAKARDLRKTKMTQEYSDWRSRLIRNWRDKGQIEPSQEKDVKRLMAALQKHLSVPQKLPLKVGIEAKMEGSVLALHHSSR
jgi:hypothetical protein